MKRFVWVLLLLGLIWAVRRAAGDAVTFGVLQLDPEALARLAAAPLDTTVVGMATFTPDVTPEQATDAVRSLRVVGIVQLDPSIREALAGRISVSGAMVVRD
jgi:hypothetical protein